jgi:hypothetical protein
MPTLRISHSGTWVESTFTDTGVTLSEKRPFSFSLTEQDAEDIRWYLEDYRVYPVEPTPTIAKRIEKRMRDVGRELFGLVLAGSDVWASVRAHLGDARVEVETELEDALVPWELMRDPVADLPLALSVPAFVRCHSKPALRPHPVQQSTGRVRILLAICRLEDDTVGFRSVARHLIRGLSAEAREPFDLEVLRPLRSNSSPRLCARRRLKVSPFTRCISMVTETKGWCTLRALCPESADKRCMLLTWASC